MEEAKKVCVASLLEQVLIYNKVKASVIDPLNINKR